MEVWGRRPVSASVEFSDGLQPEEIEIGHRRESHWENQRGLRTLVSFHLLSALCFEAALLGITVQKVYSASPHPGWKEGTKLQNYSTLPSPFYRLPSAMPGMGLSFLSTCSFCMFQQVTLGNYFLEGTTLHPVSWDLQVATLCHHMLLRLSSSSRPLFPRALPRHLCSAF